MSIVRLLIIQFNNTIERKEIPLFRGAVIESVKDSNNVLFHNHIGEGFRYSYPLIQYKRIHQKAAIVCINEGTDSIGEFFSSCNFQFKLGEKYVEMNAAHPFMEGNGRSTRIWLDLILKKRLGLCVDWSKIGKKDYLNAMIESQTDSTHIKQLLEQALTDKINDRETFMKGIDYSYYYEQED